ncbi:PREDICTED: kanadaptin [Dufourea novaeangliae]|uniref:Kanadaptin n=1 Tax=Dufourea novaeangliae TaxID=178035 RepID=A0A154P9Y5_DUFNO|nr:PREDICTED: kanadaptin [Dufourea novaeangliae]KZC08662.1 Kanadaptin [Dufourea novaeangliae]
METKINAEKACDLKADESITENCTRSFSVIPNTSETVATFKKPTTTICSKRSRPEDKHFTASTDFTNDNTDRDSDKTTKFQEHPKDQPFPYTEPPWGGKPENDYYMEILKSGVIIQTISLKEQSFYVIGRLPTCHICLAHPTISRHHAILQYRSEQDNINSKGLYVYDLGSTHGTFWNGNRIKPNVYVRVQKGHMLRFGCSQRKFILQAPLDDEEEESMYTVSELKEMRALELVKRHIDRGNETDSTEDKESVGIDWGMGEDADEETDLQENPYACIADDNLVLDDPKKTLRGWFEREGYDLHYKTEEKGPGQFLCWVDLPMEDIVGHSLKAEALVKGKKKEAVVQCALEACKILDKYGLLRQAHHEARKRKTRNWEAEDYYDSDEDNFLDRTGSIEKKREQRMRLAGKLEETVETYDSLLEKHVNVVKRISYLTDSIKNWQHENSAKTETSEEDALDAFMSNLNSSTLTKSDIAKMKVELQAVRKEEAGIIKLLNLTRPANLPALVQQDVTSDQEVGRVKTNMNATQEISSKASKIQRSMFQRRKKKMDNYGLDESSNRLISRTMTEEKVEVESDEESDTEEKGESLMEKKEIFESQQSLTFVTITATATDTDANANANTGTTTTATGALVDVTIPSTSIKGCTKDNEKWNTREIGVVTRTHREEGKKISCDQDIFADNYSTWVPPQDQAGDGKTSLNEKYGY